MASLASIEGLKLDAAPPPIPPLSAADFAGPTACLNYILYNFHLGIAPLGFYYDALVGVAAAALPAPLPLAPGIFGL